MPTVEFGYLVDACLLIALFIYSCYIFSMSVTQTVDVPPSRRLTIEVPHEVPVGPVILTLTPAPAKTIALPETLPGGCSNTVEEALQAAAEKAADPNRKPISRHFGTLSKHTFGDPVAYQKAVRDEWE